MSLKTINKYSPIKISPRRSRNLSKKLMVGGAVLAAGLGAYYLWNKKKKSQTQEMEIETEDIITEELKPELNLKKDEINIDDILETIKLVPEQSSKEYISNLVKKYKDQPNALLDNQNLMLILDKNFKLKL
jgi:hypothetical protein